MAVGYSDGGGWWDAQGDLLDQTGAPVDMGAGVVPGQNGGPDPRVDAYRQQAAQQGIRVDQGDAEVLSRIAREGWQGGAIEAPQTAGGYVNGGPSDQFYGGGRDFYAGIQGITPYGKEFSAPTAEEARQTPGYQLTIEEALRALDVGKAGKGRLRAGVGRDYANLATGLAEQNYGNTFNRALSTYGTNLGGYYQGQNARFGSQMQLGDAGFRQNEANRGFGLQQQQFGLQRDQFGNLVDQQYFDNLFRLQSLGDPTREAATRGGFSAAEQEYNAQGANARAAGTVGSANAWANALGAGIPLTEAYILARQAGVR